MYKRSSPEHNKVTSPPANFSEEIKIWKQNGTV